MLDALDFWGNLAAWIVFLILANLWLLVACGTRKRVRALRQACDAVRELRNRWSVLFPKVQQGAKSRATLDELFDDFANPATIKIDAIAIIRRTLQLWKSGDKELAKASYSAWRQQLANGLGWSHLGGYATDFGMKFTVIGAFTAFARLGEKADPIKSLGSMSLAMLTTIAGLFISLATRGLMHFLDSRRKQTESLIWETTLAFLIDLHELDRAEQAKKGSERGSRPARGSPARVPGIRKLPGTTSRALRGDSYTNLETGNGYRHA